MSDRFAETPGSPSPRPNRLALVAASVLALMVGLLAAVVVYAPRNTELESGVLLNQPREIRAFELTRASGGSFTPTDLAGQWSLVFAGFTHCPDICPATLNLLKSVSASLEEAGTPVQVVFVSIDPERDTPAVLSGYVGYFDPDFVATTGSASQLTDLMGSLGLIYAKVPQGGSTDENAYTMDHSTALVLINPQGQIAGYFPGPHRIETLTADLKQVLS